MGNRIALGTVQFGMPYGVANPARQVERDEAAAILDHAWAAGVDTLDTAAAYGESEQRLGEIGVGRWQVISKLGAIPESCKDVAAMVEESVAGSMERLGISVLHGLLVHHSQQLLGAQGEALYQALRAMKSRGTVEKIGVSIYGSDELDLVWERFQPDLVQAPFSVVDRRLFESGWLTRLHRAGTEVHVRSVFLQGLLLMAPESRPAYFSRWQGLLSQWHAWLADQALTPLQACLGFALSRPEIACVVVGVDSLAQLQEILACGEAAVAAPPQALSSKDADLVNPYRWAVH